MYIYIYISDGCIYLREKGLKLFIYKYRNTLYGKLCYGNWFIRSTEKLSNTEYINLTNSCY